MMLYKRKNIFLFLLVLFFFSCATQPVLRDRDAAERIPSVVPPGDDPSVSLPSEGKEPAVHYLTIIAAGDNLVHDPILRAGFKNKTFSFDSIFDEIRHYIQPADISFINQETILGNETIGYSGYPHFSTPPEMGAALVSAGFNVINHANNHAMDKGEQGLLSSMDYWDTHKTVRYLGIHRSEDDRKIRPVILSRNNINVGFLSYTYGTNGIALPEGKPFFVSLIESEKMTEEINALRPLCDYLVVSMHWGEEYQEVYSKNQETLAFLLAEHGVDLVLGHHPHVLQPFSVINRAGGKSMNVFYSMGNFLSAHAQPPKEALLGGLAYIKIKKTGGETSVEESGIIPTITHYNADQSGFTIYPLTEYTEELAEKHWKRKYDREMKLSFFTKKAHDFFGPALILENPFTR